MPTGFKTRLWSFCTIGCIRNLLSFFSGGRFSQKNQKFGLSSRIEFLLWDLQTFSERHSNMPLTTTTCCFGHISFQKFCAMGVKTRKNGIFHYVVFFKFFFFFFFDHCELSVRYLCRKCRKKHTLKNKIKYVVCLFVIKKKTSPYPACTQIPKKWVLQVQVLQVLRRGVVGSLR